MNTNSFERQAQHTNSMEEIFGKPISVYSRKQAIQDGVQIEVTDLAREAGFKVPVFITRSAWDRYIVPSERLQGYGQSEKGRLWDVLFMLFMRIKSHSGGAEISFEVLFLMGGNEGKDPETVTVRLLSKIGPMDFDDPKPVITISIPGEG